MFRRTLALAALMFPLSRSPFAESPRPLDAGFLRTYAETRGFRLGRPTGIQITPAGDAVLFLRSGPRSARQALFRFDPATGETVELRRPESAGMGGESEVLSAAEKARRERMRVSAAGFTSFQLAEDGRNLLAPLGDRLFLIDWQRNAWRELPLKGEAFDPKVSPDGRRVGFVRDHDVWCLDLATGRERPVTRGGTALRSHGEAEFVAAEEMNRFTGWWWSPDSTRVLFTEVDAKGVEVWQVADPAHPESAPRPQFYPRPGKANVKVRLGIAPLRGGRTTWLAWDHARYPYLARADWHAHGGLTIVVQSRDQRELALIRADPVSGRGAPLVTEHDETWVNLDQSVPRWLADGSGFLWTTERAGAWQLEHRDRSGELVRVIVPPEAGYQGLVHLDDARRAVVYAASADPTQTHLFRVELAGGEIVPLDSEAGLHAGVFAKSAGLWVQSVATPSGLARSWVHGAAVGRGNPVELPSVAENPDFRPRAEILRVGSGDGWFAEVIRPQRFDAKLKYPVLVDVYGGPHANVVQASMATHLLPQWLADQGFVVVSVENRGTPRRGRAWERAIFQRFAEVPLEDQAAGLRALGEKFPELDLTRVGIYGWSFGGYASALAVLRRPEVFQAAVAGAPVTDWLDYDTHYTERYLGVPTEGDSVYARNSLIADASGLSRPLLLLHGTGDDNVFFRHSLKLADALFRAGKRFEILPLPGLTHMVPDPVVMERQWGLTADFFRRHLGEPR